ncbi:MAG: DUF2029 domain-containing protein [Clostridia bacterium]|nr:DUF2029 domain-containing protein [Clostridia bacterium]
MTRTIQHPYLKLFLVQVGIIVVLIGGGILFFSIKSGGIGPAFDYFFSYAMSDFGQYLFFSVQKNPYIGNFHTMYTPLNFLLLLPFTFFCRGNDLFYRLSEVSVEEYNKAVVTSGAFWLSYAPYVLLFIVFYVFLVRRILPSDMEEKTWFSLALIFSNLGIYAISRGSNVQQVLLLLLVFVCAYRSPNKWLKELALLSLAAAGVCKYYPFIFGALLIKEKDYMAVLRVILYSIPLFILPFLCYEGGLANISLYLGNLGKFVYGENRISAGNNLSAYSLVYKIALLFGGGEGSSVLRYVALGFCLSILLVCAVLSIVSDNRFTQYILFNCAMTLVCPVSYYYLVIYLIFPIAEYMREYQTMEQGRKIYYLVFFSICGFLPSLVLPSYVLQTMLYFGAIGIEWVHLTKKQKQKERT